MVTQLLFGELFDVLEKRGQWTLIRTSPDLCEGWIAKDQLTFVEDEFVQNYFAQLCMVNESMALAILEETKLPVTLLKGSLLSGFTGNSFKIQSSSYSYSGSTVLYPSVYDPAKVSQIALSYLNTPFFWGGRSPLGIDDSGYIQMVYKFCGLDLPREAHSQADFGEIINFMDEVKPGDLAFFDDEQGIISHVGILLGDHQVIHAAGKVKIDKIDHQGIFDTEMKCYTHKLRIMKHI